MDEGEIYFLFAYAKNEQEDLDSRQLRVLRNLVKEEFALLIGVSPRTVQN